MSPVTTTAQPLSQAMEINHPSIYYFSNVLEPSRSTRCLALFIQEYKGQVRLNLRFCQKSKDRPDLLRPTKNGVVVPIEDFRNFYKALEEFKDPEIVPEFALVTSYGNNSRQVRVTEDHADEKIEIFLWQVPKRGKEYFCLERGLRFDREHLSYVLTGLEELADQIRRYTQNQVQPLCQFGHILNPEYLAIPASDKPIKGAKYEIKSRTLILHVEDF